MRRAEAWERWPDHAGHNLGLSLGDVVCATCGYRVVEGGFAPVVDTGALIAPYWLPDEEVTR